MFKNKYIFYIMLMVALTVNVSCFNKPQAKPEIKIKTKIGLILAENKSARNQYFLKKLQKEAEGEKIKLIIGNSQLDANEQEIQIQKMIKEKVSIVIIQPVDTQATKEHLSRLIEQNIKIIAIDSLPKEVLVDGFITPDYIRAGELQAQYVINQGTEITPLIIQGHTTNYISKKILEGNINILQNNSLVNKVIVKEVSQPFEENTYKTMEKSKDEQYNVIISHYEQSALGISKYNQEINDNKKLPLLTLDINEALLQNVTNGDIVILDTMPNLLAQVVLEVADNLLKTGNWKYDLQINNDIGLIPTKYTPVRIIDKKNIELLDERFPDLKKGGESNKQEEKTQEKTGEKQTTLKIKTKDGQEYEVKIPGEIENIEIKPDEKPQ